MALLILDISLLRFSLFRVFFVKQNNLSFIRDHYHQLTSCLHLIETNCNEKQFQRLLLQLISWISLRECWKLINHREKQSIIRPVGQNMTKWRQVKISDGRTSQAQTLPSLLIGAHKLQMSLLVPDDTLLHSSVQNKAFLKQFNLVFIWAKCCHLTLCLHLIKPNCNLTVIWWSFFCPHHCFMQPLKQEWSLQYLPRISRWKKDYNSLNSRDLVISATAFVTKGLQFNLSSFQMFFSPWVWGGRENLILS